RCPNDCSGHGTCYNMADMAKFYGPDYIQPGDGGDGVGPTYDNWDAAATVSCVCDTGYFGADCTKRMCPKGDDPLTIGQNERSVVVDVSSSTRFNGTMRITFNGETTQLEAGDSFGDFDASDCEAAFESLANVYDVDCAAVSASHGVALTVTFVSWPVFPHENNLFYHTGNPDITAFTCDISGLTNSSDLACTITDDEADDIEEYDFCSRRGTCNFNTGLCGCRDGWTGANCGTESYVYTTADALPGISLTATGEAYVGNVVELLSERASSSSFNFLSCEADGTTVFAVRGDGHLSVPDLTVIDSGIIVEDGGITIDEDGLTVEDGGASITSTAATTPVVTLMASS
ncbi:unnamed protein product, partial [Phaeothamnion confervicola]